MEHQKLNDSLPEDKALEFAKYIDHWYEMTWLNDNDKEVTTEELYKEWAAQNK